MGQRDDPRSGTQRATGGECPGSFFEPMIITSRGLRNNSLGLGPPQPTVGTRQHLGSLIHVVNPSRHGAFPN